MLREHLGLTGPKKGCAPVRAAGGEDGELHPLQKAFIRDAFQCGYLEPL